MILILLLILLVCLFINVRNIRNKNINSGETFVTEGFGDGWCAKDNTRKGRSTRWRHDRCKSLKTEKDCIKPLGKNNPSSCNWVHKSQAINTFNETGCPSKNISIWWWKKNADNPRALNDMYAYCNLTNTGTATSGQKKVCCGTNNPDCGKGKLKCKRHSVMLPPPCAKSKTYGGAPGTDSCAPIDSAKKCNYQSWCEWRGKPDPHKTSDLVNTFNNTGCPNKNPGVSWWRTQSKNTVLNDMDAYCNLTNIGTASSGQKKQCCGENQNCGKRMLTCIKQNKISDEVNKNRVLPNLTKEEIFKEKNGSDYRGFQNKTVTGKKCQKWTSQSPHKHVYNPDKYPNRGLGDHNYCRNPDNANDIWCYTTDSKKRWEWCDPKKKNSQEIFKEDNGSDYRGFQNKTLSGKTCKKWSSNFVSKHSGVYDKGLSNNNYCRNPDSSKTIWCFTDDDNNVPEFCSPLNNGGNTEHFTTQNQSNMIHKTKLLPDKVLKDYIHKTRVKPYSCPKCPDMSDYVLKSSVSCH